MRINRRWVPDRLPAGHPPLHRVLSRYGLAWLSLPAPEAHGDRGLAHRHPNILY